MRNIAILKEVEINKFYAFMKRFSIEKYPIITTEMQEPELVVTE